MNLEDINSFNYYTHNFAKFLQSKQNKFFSSKVQAAIQNRISIYPEEIERRKHKARAYLPEKAAYILRRESALIASAIRTVSHSDPLERKVCRAMRYFPPEQRIMANVKMTKCLYAMAVHCRYASTEMFVKFGVIFLLFNIHMQKM